MPAAIACAAILLQLSPFCFADSNAPTTASSAETQLLTSLVTDTGAKLSQSELQTQIAQAVSTYNKTAPVEGREDRLVEALTQMNIMTSAQAQGVRNQIDESIQEQISKNPMADSQAIVSVAVQQALSRTAGAQFSSCAAGTLGAFAGGIAISAIGVILQGVTSDCVTQTDSNVYTAEGEFVGTDTSTSCQHPDQDLGEGLMIGGLIAAVVGMFVVSYAVGGC